MRRTVFVDGRGRQRIGMRFCSASASFGWVDPALRSVQFPARIREKMLMKSKLLAAAVAAAVVLSAPGAHAQSFINVLTGGTSGVYYPLGVALGKIYGDKIPDVKTQVQATKASVENLILLQQGRGEIAFTLGDSPESGLGGRRGGRLQVQARQAAQHRRDLSELHPDRRDRRTAASRRWPTSRARASRSARRNPAPNSMRARSLPPPA